MSKVLTLSIVSLAAGSLLTLGVAAGARQEKGAQQAPKAAPAGPGPIHQRMTKRAGEYTIAKKMSFPGQPPMEATGHATITSILGGRFLHEDNDGLLFGRPVASSMISGYNDETEKFEETWGWTGSNRLFSATGTSTDGGKTVHYTSSYDNGKGKTERIEIDVKSIDDDHFSATFVERLPDGRDGLTMEAVYTRQK